MNETPENVPPPPPHAPGRLARLADWLLCRSEQAALDSAAPHDAAQTLALDKARSYLGAAQLALDPAIQGDPAAAAPLCQLALYWAARGSLEDPGEDLSLRAIWSRASPSLSQRAGSPVDPGIERLVASTEPDHLATFSADELAEICQRSVRLVEDLLTARRRHDAAGQRLALKRALRVSGVVALLAALVASVALLARSPDLARGKPWRTSSTYGGFSPQKHSCDGRETRIFFHTEQDAAPWIEIDLKAPTRVRQVEVRNRSDCCTDRSIPLVIEVSDDQKQWAEVARQDKLFSDWMASFPPRTTRYVRLRVPRRTFLHLEAIAVR